MNAVESMTATAKELISLAQKRGFDIAAMDRGDLFWQRGRIISIWRKGDTIQYSLQGPIGVLPRRFQNSSSHFYGMWDEAGTVESLEQALDLLSAWLIDWKEADDLPVRSIRRGGIG